MMTASPSATALYGEMPLAHCADQVGAHLGRHHGARIREPERFVLQHLVHALGVQLRGDASVGVEEQHGTEAREELAERPVVAGAHRLHERTIVQRPYPPLVPASLLHTHCCRPRTLVTVNGER